MRRQDDYPGRRRLAWNRRVGFALVPIAYLAGLLTGLAY